MLGVAEYITETVVKTAKLRGYGGEVGLDDNILNVGVDSLDIMEIVMGAENKFHVRVDDDKMGGIKTINEIIKLIETAE